MRVVRRSCPRHAGRLRSGRQERLPLARRHQLRQQDLHPHGQGPHALRLLLRRQGLLLALLASLGRLYRGNTKVGTLNSDWSITASDGTTLKMSVLTNGPRRSAEDLTDAVFKASAPKKGTFAGVRYVERTNTRGGMPLTKCSASQQGQRLSRPFEADYTFWR